nr:transposase [uncultured Anaerosporobacter sp.]
MYFVGIDISKYKHDCFITTESGHVVCKSFTIKNNHDGFEDLLTVLNSLDHQVEIRIGFLISFSKILSLESCNKVTHFYESNIFQKRIDF